MAISSIHGSGIPMPSPPSAGAKAPASGGAAFGRLVEDLLAGESASSARAEQAVQALATGQAEGIHTVALAVAQADLNFRLILELRNRLTEAYQEMMRMQV